MWRFRTIVLTGPESTGKTTLAAHIAASLGTEWVPEAARLYAERVGRELTVADVEPIAREHIAMVDDATERVKAAGGRVLVLDTDLVSTIVYARHYYGVRPAWLDLEARKRISTLYLLCDVDLDWSGDGIRDRPADREAMFTDFQTVLRQLGARVAVITGRGEVRVEAALRQVNAS
jgi:nicotinamide riboside kinase